MRENAPSANANTSSNVRSSYADNKSDFFRDRVKAAFISSATATAAIVGAAFLLLIVLRIGPPLPNDYRLSDTFSEWEQDNDDVEVGNPVQEINTAVSRLGIAVSGVVNSFTFQVDATTTASSIGGIVRFLSLLAISSAVFWSYRKCLQQRYALEEQQALYDDFTELKGRWGWFLLTRILYGLATLLGSYVMISLVWLGFARVFGGLQLDVVGAWIVMAAFVWASSFAAAYWASAVTTRELLYIGGVTVVSGLAVTFAIALPLADGSHWWENSISSAGKQMPAAPLFTASLMCMVTVLWLMWYDIDSILLKAATSVAPKRMTRIKWLYRAVIVGLLLIGFFRVSDPIQTHFLNFVFHSVIGAVGAIGGLFFVCREVSRIITETSLTPWYRWFFGVAAAISIVAIVLSSVQLSPLAIVMPGKSGIINLAAAELIIFTLVGMVLFATTEMLLLQADIPRNGSTTS